MALTKATYSMISGAVVNILDYGADPTGVSDSTAAIAAAQAVACAGTLGLDGVTIVAQSKVYFPAGTYKVTNLTYVGAPWFGDGMNATFIKMYASSGACVNAVGTNGARKLLSISDMSFDGSSATGTAYCLSIGYNQRSMGALQRVRIKGFPYTAIYFAEQTWMMSFYDVYCSYNANGTGSLRTAICINNTLLEAQVLAINWFNLNLENNGFISSTVGGGIEIATNVAATWAFYGGTWEGNYGIAEARFQGITGVYIDGLYLESEAASVVNGLLFNNCPGTVSNSRIAGEIGMTGDGIKVTNGANIHISEIYSNVKWVNDISVSATSAVYTSGGNAALLFSVANGGTLQRLTTNRVQLTDAATIAVDAALANSFYVTVGGARAMGAPTNASVGQRILFTITQNGTGGYALTWNAIYKIQSWSDTGNTASKRSLIEFEYDGTNWVQCSLQVPYF
jgi:hypothetical protein